MAQIEIFGLMYNTETKKVTLADGSAPVAGADFTFEYHPGYNPLQYATEETANALTEILRKSLPKDCLITSAKTEPTGPIQPPAQWLIYIYRFGIGDGFNAGLIANSIIRSGSIGYFLAGLKDAGILF